jgi:aspartate racemase
MRLLGIIGGTSWVSTREYYRLINEGVKKAMGGSHSARLLMSSVEFQELSDAMARGDWGFVEEALLIEARRLSAGGAEAILIASNTMHLYADEIAQAAGIPVLHIADAVGARVVERATRTVGLMGTRHSMEKDFYRRRLRDRFGIECLIPEEVQRAKIDSIIFDELCQGTFLEPSKRYIIEAAHELIARGAKGIVLGCTELPLVVGQEDLSVPRFDTMSIHAEAGARFLTEQSPD